MGLFRWIWGKNEGPKWAQKVGSAAWVFEYNEQGKITMAFAASGAKGKQTVPRAELTAALAGFEISEKGLKSDCEYVVKGLKMLCQRFQAGHDWLQF